jgi:BASS family bile acid:Na+ symporter
MTLILLKISIAIFMAGNLLDMGLRLNVGQAFASLKNVRFVVTSLIWGFVLGPALAYGITVVLPLEQHYGIGLLFMGMAPCAPFLPMVMNVGKGDLGYTAALMLMMAIGSVIFMPIAVPLMIDGFSVSAMAIAQPLITMILVPLGVGMLVLRLWPGVAGRIQPFVKKLTGVATLAVVVLCGVIYGKDMLGAAGSYVILAEVIFFTILTIVPYALARRMPHEQRIVLMGGMATRNLGAAMAPLFAAVTPDQHAVIVVAIGIPLMMLYSFGAARLLTPASATSA